MAKYKGKSVRLNKPSRVTKGQPGYGRKKFKVFVKSGSKVKKVMFGDPNMRIKKSSPSRRKSFRARHKCATAKDRTTARYWSCKNGRRIMAKKVSWTFGGKRYTGTLIRETKTHKFARTKNGKTKKIKKGR